MKETTRFTDAQTKEIVEAAARKEIDTTFTKLEAANKIHEVSNREERLNAIVKDYFSADKDTTIVTQINADRHALNNMIHAGRQERGEVSKEDHTVTVRDPKNLNPVEKHFSQSYQVGEYVFVNKVGMEGVRLGTEAQIVKIDQNKNSLTCETKRGKSFEVDLRKDGDKISVYTEREIKLSEGDGIIFNKTDNEIGVVNGTKAEIEQIDKHGNIKATDKDGNNLSFNIHEKNYLSLGYVVTVPKSQGQTAERVIYNADTTKINDYKAGYVSISRGREDVQVYTNNKDELKEQMKQAHEKESTLEYEKKHQDKDQSKEDKEHEKEHQDKGQDKEDKGAEKAEEKTEDRDQKTEDREHEDKSEDRTEDKSEDRTEDSTEDKGEERIEDKAEEREREQEQEHEHEDAGREIEMEM